MNKILASIVAAMVFLMSVPAPSFGQAGPGSSVIIYGAANDPCQYPGFLKSSTAVNISATGTTAIIPAVTGKVISVCSVQFSSGGTTPTAIFKTGTRTSADCDTGAVSVSGTYLLPTTAIFSFGSGDATKVTTPKSSQFCITAGGTSPSLQGIVIWASH